MKITGERTGAQPIHPPGSNYTKSLYFVAKKTGMTYKIISTMTLTGVDRSLEYQKKKKKVGIILPQKNVD